MIAFSLWRLNFPASWPSSTALALHPTNLLVSIVLDMIALVTVPAEDALAQDLLPARALAHALGLALTAAAREHPLAATVTNVTATLELLTNVQTFLAVIIHAARVLAVALADSVTRTPRLLHLLPGAQILQPLKRLLPTPQMAHFKHATMLPEE